MEQMLTLRHPSLLRAGLALSGLTAGCSGAEEAVIEFSAEEVEQLAELSPPPSLPADPTNAVADDPDAALLGQRLFFDPGMSADGSISCASCHMPDQGFTDGLSVSTGLGQATANAPTILGAAHSPWQFWDGRADSLWAQAVGPLENPVEHGSSRLEVARHVAEDPLLSAEYEELFGPLPDLSDLQRFPSGAARPDPENPEAAHARAWEGMHPDDQDAINAVMANVGKALAAYERGLVLGRAPFDDFVDALLEGDAEAQAVLSRPAQRGARLFLSTGCVNCHSGPLLSNQDFQNLGLGPRDWLEPSRGRWDGIERVREDVFNGMGPYSDAPDDPDVVDKLESLVKEEQALGAFKIPSLRPVALTAPYMHGGHFQTLQEVVHFYAVLDEEPIYGKRESSLRRLPLDARDEADLVAFMDSLLGELPPEELLEPPAD